MQEFLQCQSALEQQYHIQIPLPGRAALTDTRHIAGDSCGNSGTPHPGSDQEPDLKWANHSMPHCSLQDMHECSTEIIKLGDI